MRVAAFRVAMILGASVLVTFVATKSWVLAFGAAGVIMLATALVNAAIMPRPATPTDAPKASAKAPAFWVAYRSFLAQPRAALVLAFMFFYRLGDIMMFAMSKPLLRDIGIDLGHRGALNGFGTVAFIAGSLVGGAIMARLSLRDARAAALPAELRDPALRRHGGVQADVRGRSAPWCSSSSSSRASATTAQSCSSSTAAARAFSASHYAFATAVVSLGSTLSGFASGPLDEHSATRCSSPSRSWRACPA